jgi:D-alanyl-D-alanine carboxypeptidase
VWILGLTLGACRAPATLEPDSSRATLSKEPVQTLLVDFLKEVQGRNPVPGIVVAIYGPERGLPAMAAAQGWADPAAKLPMKPDQRFLAGSVGKTFFGGLAVQLWAERRLDLDRPIAELLGDLHLPRADLITTRNLLTHTSGYGEYDGDFMGALVEDPLRMREREDWLGVLRRQGADKIAIGTFRYSDLNYVVLAMVLERVLGESAYGAISTRFLAPLGLADTGPADQPTLAGLAVGFEGRSGFLGQRRVLEQGRLVYNPQFEWGGGGFYSTPIDLVRWFHALRAGSAYPAALWPAVIARPAGLPESATAWIGLGLHVDPTPLGTAFGHSGYIPGYVTWVRWYEDLELGVAVMVNSSDWNQVLEDGYLWLDALAQRLDRELRR